MRHFSKRNVLHICLLFLLIFAMRLPYLSNSPFEAGESWRQGDTEAMARNFAEEKFHILYPQLNYDGAPPNYAQLEFQITTFLIAILYKIFGCHYALARLVPTLFFIGSAFFLYLFIKKFYAEHVSWIIVLLYAMFPLNLYFSRAIMPESAAIFFMVGAYYLFYKSLEKESNALLLVSAFMTAAAIAVKTPTVFIGIAMFALCIIKYKRNIVTQWQLWLFATISLGLPVAYYGWLGTVAEFTFVNKIGAKHILPNFATAIFTKEALQFYYKELPDSFTIICLILFVFGLFKMKWKEEYPIILMAIAIAFELVAIVAVIRFNYYLFFFTPIVAIFAGKAIGNILTWKKGIWIAVILVMSIGALSVNEVRTKYHERETILMQAEFVKKYTEPDDLIVIGTLSPELLNASGRKGWRANIGYYPFIPEGPKRELEYFIQHGAAYFVPAKGYIYNDRNNEYRNYLEANFKKIVVEENEQYSFYQLQ